MTLVDQQCWRLVHCLQGRLRQNNYYMQKTYHRYLLGKLEKIVRKVTFLLRLNSLIFRGLGERLQQFQVGIGSNNILLSLERHDAAEPPEPRIFSFRDELTEE